VKNILFHIRMYFTMMSVHLRSAVMYQADFWIGILGIFLTQGAGIVFVWTIFQRIPEIAGWKLWEVALLYALVVIPRGLTELLCDGQWQLRKLVYTGEFDRLLVRPVSPLLQVLCQFSSIHGLGGVILGAMIVARAIRELHLVWSVWDYGLLAFTLLNGLILISATNLLTNSLAFWDPSASSSFPMIFIQSMDLVKFPLTLYDRAIQFALTWLVPFAFISYYPGLILLKKGSPPWIAYVTPLSGIVVALIVYGVWKLGLARYQSTGQ
jgi:ABC-2 type transport system permease protein